MTSADQRHRHDADRLPTDHVCGAPGSEAMLVEYGDYECAGCKEAEPLTRHLVEIFGDRLAFTFRHFPLIDVHPQAERAAEAAEASVAQGRFWEMHHLLFAHAPRLGPTVLRELARSLELNLGRFDADMADRVYLQRVVDERLGGERRGVRASPSFFLNGTPVDVSFGMEHLECAVRSALNP